MDFGKTVLVALSVIYINWILNVQCQEQYVEMYTNTTYNTSACIIIFREDQPDMRVHNSCLFRQYGKGVRGRILVYRQPNFTGLWNYLREDLHADYTPSSDWWPSFRFVGVISNLAARSLNLYERADWEGEHTLVTTDTPDFTGSFQSVKVTGPIGNEDWTFYTLPNYGGFSICIKYPDGLRDLQAEIGVTPGTIKSFRAGCFSRIIKKKIAAERGQDPLAGLGNETH